MRHAQLLFDGVMNGRGFHDIGNGWHGAAVIAQLLLTDHIDRRANRRRWCHGQDGRRIMTDCRQAIVVVVAVMVSMIAAR